MTVTTASRAGLVEPLEPSRPTILLAPGLWQNPPRTSYASLVVRRPGATPVRARTEHLAARVIVGHGAEEMLLVAELGTATLRTGHPRMDHRLRSPSWLDAANWPSILLRSTIPLRRLDAGTAAGELSVGSKTVPVQLTVSSRGHRYVRSGGDATRLLELLADGRAPAPGYAPEWAQPFGISLALHLELARHG